MSWAQWCLRLPEPGDNYWNSMLCADSDSKQWELGHPETCGWLGVLPGQHSYPNDFRNMGSPAYHLIFLKYTISPCIRARSVVVFSDPAAGFVVGTRFTLVNRAALMCPYSQLPLFKRTVLGHNVAPICLEMVAVQLNFTQVYIIYWRDWTAIKPYERFLSGFV